MEVGRYSIGAIIQARLGSTRLPNKILLPIGKKRGTILSQIFHRLKETKSVSKIILATSENRVNDTLEEYSKEQGIECYRGDEDNVLSRFSDVVKGNNFDYVLRFTAVKLLENFIEYVVVQNLDYCYSTNLPLGCNFEIIKSSLIVEANEKSTSAYDKEHVTPYIKRNSKNKKLYKFEEDSILNDLRLTVDYPSDYSFIYLLSSMLGDKTLDLNNIKKIVNSNYWLKEINKKNFQKKEYENLEEEIKDLMPVIKEREMKRVEKMLTKNE